jgi:hypothetical protein
VVSTIQYATDIYSLLSKHNLIPEIACRLSLATAVFHAYAHQFCCQIVFNPRRRVGFGMTNGEGNERIWSLCKDTIASEHISGVGFLWISLPIF